VVFEALRASLTARAVVDRRRVGGRLRRAGQAGPVRAEDRAGRAAARRSCWRRPPAPASSWSRRTRRSPTCGSSCPTSARSTCRRRAIRRARRPRRPLRQQRLRFLDAVNGELAFRLKVVLDLPVVGIRTLDQQVKVAIKDGAFDYRALESGLSWLEGQFVDVGIDDGRFVVGWSVPLMATKEIISWALDPEAMVVGIFNRVPLRCLADFRIPGGGGGGKKDGGRDSRRTLRSLAISDIAIKLSMAAPRHVDVGGGTLLFGGDDAPGIVDLQLGGGLCHPPGPGRAVGGDRRPRHDAQGRPRRRAVGHGRSAPHRADRSHRAGVRRLPPDLADRVAAPGDRDQPGAGARPVAGHRRRPIVGGADQNHAAPWGRTPRHG
jgi:hypothetical protein